MTNETQTDRLGCLADAPSEAAWKLACDMFGRNNPSKRSVAIAQRHLQSISTNLANAEAEIARLRDDLRHIAEDGDGPDGEQRPKSYFTAFARAALNPGKESA